jgi:hypothetical protein
MDKKIKKKKKEKSKEEKVDREFYGGYTFDDE